MHMEDFLQSGESDMLFTLNCDVKGIRQMHLQMISSEHPQGYVSARPIESFRPNHRKTFIL